MSLPPSLGPNRNLMLEWKRRIEGEPWVTIRQCPDRSMWYRDEIHQQFLIFRVDQDGLWTRDREGFTNFIKFADAEF